MGSGLEAILPALAGGAASAAPAAGAGAAGAGTAAAGAGAGAAGMSAMLPKLALGMGVASRIMPDQRAKTALGLGSIAAGLTSMGMNDPGAGALPSAMPSEMPVKEETLPPPMPADANTTAGKVSSGLPEFSFNEDPYGRLRRLNGY